MTVLELAQMVHDMRRAQRAYFRDRTPAALDASKRLERALDAAVNDILSPPEPGLFDEHRGSDHE